MSAGKWTAYFDNLLHGTDAISAIGHLSRELRCHGLAITSVPHTIGRSDSRRGRPGAVQFTLFGPLPTHFLNYVRAIEVVYDDRWIFGTSGTEQPFEEIEAYKSRRKRDRFTSEMLDRYCKALGVDVFNPDAYGPDSFFIENDEDISPDSYVMTLAEVQEWLEIEPGMARDLPG